MTPRLAVLAAAVALSVPSLAMAAPPSTPDSLCQKARFAAAGKYDACIRAALAARYARPEKHAVIHVHLKRCRSKYRVAARKMAQTFKGQGTACDQPRFAEESGTIVDRLTGLQWEKKAPPGGGVHGPNLYTWTVVPPYPSGTVFTTFLAALNDPTACFAGACDWRLPTIGELQTLIDDRRPCVHYRCVDPIFGPLHGGWSSTTLLGDPTLAWFVQFDPVVVSQSTMTDEGYAIAVRGGLD